MKKNRNKRVFLNESKLPKSKKRITESTSSEEFIYKLNGDEYKFVCTVLDTRDGFAHRVKLYKNDDIVVSARCDYLNRTWETFRFQSAMAKALEKAMRVHEDMKPELSKIYDKVTTESHAGGEIESEEEVKVEEPIMDRAEPKFRENFTMTEQYLNRNKRFKSMKRKKL